MLFAPPLSLLFVLFVFLFLLLFMLFIVLLFSLLCLLLLFLFFFLIPEFSLLQWQVLLSSLTSILLDSLLCLLMRVCSTVVCHGACLVPASRQTLRFVSFIWGVFVCLSVSVLICGKLYKSTPFVVAVNTSCVCDCIHCRSVISYTYRDRLMYEVAYLFFCF